MILRPFQPHTPDQFFFAERYEQYLRDEAEKHRKLGSAYKWLTYLVGLPLILMNTISALVYLITDIGGGDYWDKITIALLFSILYWDFWQFSRHNYYLMKRYALTLLSYREGR